jgi:hypothetical protein
MKPTIALITTLLTALTTSFSVNAQIYEYKDASGKTVYTDQLPAGVSGRTRDSGERAAASGSTQKSVAERDVEFKKRQQEQKAAAEKNQKEAEKKSGLSQECVNARGQLQVYESGERIATRDAQGERVYLDDSQRAAEIERTRKFIAETCK